MAAPVENHSPEISGLAAATSGFALIEATFIRRAALWFVAVISLGALAMAGVTAAGDAPIMAAAGELPVAAEAMPPVPAQPAAERTASEKKPSVLPVVLRGQPSIASRRS